MCTTLIKTDHTPRPPAAFFSLLAAIAALNDTHREPHKIRRQCPVQCHASMSVMYLTGLDLHDSPLPVPLGKHPDLTKNHSPARNARLTRSALSCPPCPG